MPPLNTFTRSAVAVAISQAVTVGSANAATIQVNSTADDVNNVANCTLRDAIATANAGFELNNGCDVVGAFGDADTIEFSDNLNGASVALTQGQLLVSAPNLTIDGPDRDKLTIDAGGSSTVVSVFNDANVAMNDLIITGGYIVSGYGGGLSVSQATVRVEDCIITGNSAGNAGGGVSVYRGTLSLINSTISNNTASFEGGGIELARQGSINLTNSTISGNSARDNGGGIYINTSAPSGTNVVINNSTISGNTARSGGGIFSTSFANLPSNVSLENSTIGNNTAIVGNGGGIYSNNSQADISLINSLIAGNQGFEIRNRSGTVRTKGVNLLGEDATTNASAFNGFTPSPSDITATSDGTNPTAITDIISPLADNDGPTQTHALLSTSIARDAGDNATCLATDQRGNTRPADLADSCDIGAFEFTPFEVASVVVNTDSDISVDGDIDCTLREAIATANAQMDIGNGCVIGGISGATYAIDFAPNLDGSVVTLSQGKLGIFDTNLAINGPSSNGLTIDANGMSRVMEINSSTVNLNNMTITGGSYDVGAGMFIGFSSKVSISNSTVTGNSAIVGGGIAAGTSTIRLTNSTISGNSAIFAAGILSDTSNLHLTHSTVSANTASYSVGGISTYTNPNLPYDGGTVLTNSIVSGNVSPSSGVAEIYNSRGDILSQGTNLVGSSEISTAEAFVGFTPTMSDVFATSDGTSPTPLSNILQPLADNGGTSQTHLLQSESPAVNAVSLTNCLITNDQRGLSRPQGPTCDIGSVELEALTLTVNQMAVDETAMALTATVSRASNALTPLNVTLTSSDTSEATVPATITIPANALSATFVVGIRDDTIIDGVQSVAITASARDFSTGMASLEVFDDDDLDSDGVAKIDDNCPIDSNPDQADFEGDGIGDACDSDTDGDGLPDVYELANGLNPRNSFDRDADADDDGFTNFEEFGFGTDPNVPDADTNNNGIPDSIENHPRVNLAPILQLLLLDD